MKYIHKTPRTVPDPWQMLNKCIFYDLVYISTDLVASDKTHFNLVEAKEKTY